MFGSYSPAVPAKPTRASAEAKVSVALDTLDETEKALLFWLLRNGLGWTTERAQQVLKKAGWWLA